MYFPSGPQKEEQQSSPLQDYKILMPEESSTKVRLLNGGLVALSVLKGTKSNFGLMSEDELRENWGSVLRESQCFHTDLNQSGIMGRHAKEFERSLPKVVCVFKAKALCSNGRRLVMSSDERRGRSLTL